MNEEDFKKLLNDALEPIKNTQNQHSESLVNIETKIGVYGDMYKINNDNSRKLEKRVKRLEDESGLETPPELVLAEVH